MIIRGTTPYHSFILPYRVNEIKELYITYLQNEEIILDKSLDAEGIELVNLLDLYDNAHMEDYTEEEIEEIQTSSQLTIHLSQEDTLLFHFYPAARKNIAIIQVRVLTTDDEAYASNPIRERIMGVLKEGVIGNE